MSLFIAAAHHAGLVTGASAEVVTGPTARSVTDATVELVTGSTGPVGTPQTSRAIVSAGSSASTAEWLTAIGTIGAVVVAVGIASARGMWSWRKKPVLSLKFDPQSPLDFITDVGTTGGHVSHWLRLQVANKAKKRTAHDTEVLIARMTSTGRRASIGGRVLDSASLIWSSLHKNGVPTTRTNVPPGLSRRIDLLSFHKWDDLFQGNNPNIPAHLVEGDNDAGIALIQLDPKPADNSQVLIDEGTTTFVLAVTSRDTDSRFYKISVTWDGRWHDKNAIADHLAIDGPIEISAPT